MDDFLIVNRAEPPGELDGQVGGKFRLDGTALGQPCAERLTRHKLHRIEKMLGLVVEKEDTGNVGVAHARGRPRFTQKKRLDGRIAEPIGLDDFQRDFDLQALVKRFVGHAHGAPTQLVRRTIGTRENAVTVELSGVDFRCGFERQGQIKQAGRTGIRRGVRLAGEGRAAVPAGRHGVRRRRTHRITGWADGLMTADETREISESFQRLEIDRRQKAD